ncbi:ENR1 protein, partial [Phainopepla nitens]|nr:ENR1 protein [Phainopepla nitens]
NQTDLCWYKSPGANPYQSIDHLKSYWEQPERTENIWKAPDGIYWICGQQAYSELLRKWEGTCTLRVIQPSFFVIRKSRSNILRTPL